MGRYLLGLAACTLLAVLLVRRRFVLVTVSGASMMPTLAPGDRVLVRRASASRLSRGQVIVVERPGEDGHWLTPLRGHAGRREWIIKRVVAVPGDPRPVDCLPATAGPPGPLVPPGKLVVLGDNSAWSQDSRQIGYIPGERLLGMVVRRLGG